VNRLLAPFSVLPRECVSVARDFTYSGLTISDEPAMLLALPACAGAGYGLARAFSYFAPPRPPPWLYAHASWPTRAPS
jgi:hypothetical protein